MTHFKPRIFSLTEGEQSILWAYIVVSLFGAALAFTIVTQLEGEGSVLRALDRYDIWMIVAGMIGTAIGLRSAHKWLGGAGILGLGRAAIGLVVISFVAAIAGGTLALPGYGTMFGPFALFLMFFDNHVLLAFWVVLIFAAHLLFAIHRRERNSIFALTDDGIPT